MAQLKIPYESLDPLTIGASGDESKVYREELELEVPDGNLLAAIYPDEPEPVGDADRGGAGGARVAGLRAALLRAARRARRRSPWSSTTSSGRRRSRGCCPAVFDAIEAAGKPAVVACANGKVFPMSESDIEQKIGRENLDRMERLGIHVPPERAAERRGVHVRRRLLARHAGVADDRRRRVRPEDHDRPGAVEPLGRGRRREADPPRRRLRRDDRVEPLRVRPLAADALRRVRGPDALGHRRGGDDVRAPVHDERRPRHARPRDRVHLRRAPRRAPAGDRALQRDLRVRAPRARRPTSRSAASSPRPTTSSSTPAGAACPPTSSSRTAGR